MFDPEICKPCPLNKVKGIHKLIFEPTGARVLIVSQSPSPEENEREELLTWYSPQGKFLWTAIKQAGIDPNDCDVTAALRCIPGEVVTGSYSSYVRVRKPDKKEIKCCQAYTQQFVQITTEQKKTKAVLVLGVVAAKQLLGGEWRKDKRIFDSAKLGMRVFLTDHPGFFLRGGIRGVNESDDRLKAFRQTLRAMAEFVGSGAEVLTSRQYLEQQKYIRVDTEADAWFYAEKLKAWALKKNERLAVDVEDDVPDDFNETGTESTDPMILSVAISPKPGYSVMFVVDHPKGRPEERDGIVEALKWLLSDKKVHLTMHYGASDADKLWQLLKIKTPGYDLDTFTSMYFNQVGRFSYGITTLVEEYEPQFSGYKYIIAPYIGPKDLVLPKAAQKSDEATYKYIKSKSTMHFSQIPLRVLNLYNNADADVTKRFEILSRDAAPAALQRVYADMGHLLYRMERNGPLVDYNHLEKLKEIWPPLVDHGRKVLQAEAAKYSAKVAADPTKFNPNTPEHVGWLLWDKLQIPYPNPKVRREKYSTEKEILLQIAPEWPIAKQVLDYRKLAKTKSTYITGYENCANLNGGRLRTKWWQTGTRTGRLSSGGSKEKIKGVINLQNVQKNPHIRNIIVSDLRWRALFKLLDEIIREGADDSQIEYCILKEFGDMTMFLEFDQGQVEVRMAAQVANDAVMIADCELGDIHSRVGHAMTGWPMEKIANDNDTRTRTKNIHFGTLFGLMGEGVLKYIRNFDPQTTLTVDTINEYQFNYFDRYRGVKNYIAAQHDYARANNCVHTIFGMRRPVLINEEMKDLFDDYGQPAYWKNIAVNTPIQGSAHQLLMCGLIQLIRQPKKYALLGTPQMEVHDNLVMGIQLKNLLQCYWLAKELLEQETVNTVKSDFPNIDWKVKLEVDGAGGFRFGVKVKFKDKDMKAPHAIGTFLRKWYEANVQYNVELKKMQESAIIVMDEDAA